MVSMDVGIHDIFQLNPQFFQKLEVSLELFFYGINDDSFQSFRIKQHIGVGPGVPVKELPKTDFVA